MYFLRLVGVSLLAGSLAACSGGGTAPVSGTNAPQQSVSTSVHLNPHGISAADAVQVAQRRRAFGPLLSVKPTALTFTSRAPQTLTVTSLFPDAVFAGSSDTRVATVFPPFAIIFGYFGGSGVFTVTPQGNGRATIGLIDGFFGGAIVPVTVSLAPSPSPTPTRAPSPSPTPTRLPPPSPTPTPTRLPSPSPTPTQAPSATPTSTALAIVHSGTFSVAAAVNTSPSITLSWVPAAGDILVVHGYLFGDSVENASGWTALSNVNSIGPDFLGAQSVWQTVVSTSSTIAPIEQNTGGSGNELVESVWEISGGATGDIASSVANGGSTGASVTLPSTTPGSSGCLGQLSAAGPFESGEAGSSSGYTGSTFGDGSDTDPLSVFAGSQGSLTGAQSPTVNFSIANGTVNLTGLLTIVCSS